MSGSIRIPIHSTTGIVVARRQARILARNPGFSRADRARIVAAVSELTRNVLDHAGEGEMFLSVDSGRDEGIVIVVRDRGPGIRDVERVTTVGSVTARRRVSTLAGVRVLADEFDIESRVGAGTTVTVKKWAE